MVVSWKYDGVMIIERELGILLLSSHSENLRLIKEGIEGEDATCAFQL